MQKAYCVTLVVTSTYSGRDSVRVALLRADSCEDAERRVLATWQDNPTPVRVASSYVSDVPGDR